MDSFHQICKAYLGRAKLKYVLYGTLEIHSGEP